MKMNKKKVLSLTLVIVLIAILSFGTLAWFNDADKVTNTFYVASSKNDPTPNTPDDIFSVDVYEEVDKDGDGKPELAPDEGETFEDILPGQTIPKAPYVENTGNYQQYVRVIFTFKSAADWHTLFTKGSFSSPMDLLKLYPDFYAHWESFEDDWFTYENDTYTYVYYLKTPLQPDAVVGTFTEVNIPWQLEQEDVVGIGSITLDVQADAVQVDNLPEDVTNAKQAFDKIGWDAGAAYGS